MRADLGIGGDLGGAVDRLDRLGDLVDLLQERVGILANEAEAGRCRAPQPHRLAREVDRAGPALGPVARDHDRHLVVRELGLQQLEFGRRVVHEVVDRDDARQPVVVAHVVDVALEVGHALAQGCEVLGSEVLLVDAAVHLQRAHCRDDHRQVGPQAGLAALDVDELLGAQVGAEAGLGDDPVGELQIESQKALRALGRRPISQSNNHTNEHTVTLSIIGAGNVGQALAGAFAKRGDSVVVGTPGPEKYRHAIEPLGVTVRIIDVQTAIVASEVVILAVPYNAAESIARSVPSCAHLLVATALSPQAIERLDEMPGSCPWPADRNCPSPGFHECRLPGGSTRTTAVRQADRRGG
jgi:hypothetical protein